MRRVALLFVVVLPACAPVATAPPASGNQTERTIDLPGSQRMRYLLYLPDGYATDTAPWPLILFLHGGGEAGNNLFLVKKEGLPRLLQQGRHIPLVVASPLSPRKAWSIPDLVLFLDEIERTYRVDRERVYVSGLSTGAYASWLLAIHYPDRIAAIAPVTTHKTPPDLCRMKSVPVWAFHNAGDSRAPARVTKRIAEALKACGGDVRQTIYPRKGHDAWSETYNRADLYEWFLRQRREPGPSWREAPRQPTGRPASRFGES